jgi:hypothetical protein
MNARGLSGAAAAISIVLTSPALADTVSPQAPLLSSPMAVGWVLVTAGLVVIGFLLVQSGLKSGTWSLGDALMEPYTPPAPTPAPANWTAPATVMVSSSSRLIAVLGFILLLVVYLSFACLYILSIALGHGSPEWIDKASSFMMSGLTLFAPYAVNKVSSIGK